MMPQRSIKSPPMSAPTNRADRAPEAHDGEQALALVRGVEVVGEGPELGDDHHVEHAHPEEERDAGPSETARSDRGKEQRSGSTTKNIDTELISQMRLILLAMAP